MPKSSKRRKEKAADFTKAKLKLGKGKQTPSNAIDTSFKAHSIALPYQSISAVKQDGTPTTRRKLSLEDLLVNIKHHNSGTRKDAIFGLRELLDTHWELIDSSLPTIINTTVRNIGDEDMSVRKALLSFYSWLIPRIPRDDLVPHTPLILLFTTSAQTHIFPEIRIDAVRFLNIFLEHFPSSIVQSWDSASDSHGSRVLEGYLGVLSAGTVTGDSEGPPVATSTASVMLTPGSKLVVLQSLARFLKAAPEISSVSSSLSSPDNAWFLSSHFSTPEAYATFNKLLQPSSQIQLSNSKTWHPEMDPESDNIPISSSLVNLTGPFSIDLRDLSDNLVSMCKNFDESASPSGIGRSFAVRLAKSLHSTLVSVFLDCAPAVFSPSATPVETDMALVFTVVSVTSTLYGKIIQDAIPAPSAVEELRTFLGYMTPFFPFYPSGRRDVKDKIEQIFQDLNLMYCNLTSRLVLASQTESSSSQTNILANDSSQANRVYDYVLQLLRGQALALDSQIVRTLSPAAYNSLLPTLWSLINYSGRNQEYLVRSGDVLLATLEHAVKSGSKSAVKRSSFDFVARLVLLETDASYRGAFRLGVNADVDRALEEWITHLPQVLWELGASNATTSETIVLFLLRMLQRRSPLVHERTLASLQTRMAPYFFINHPTRGALLGPHAKLSGNGSGLGRRILDMAIILCSQGPSAEILRDSVDQALLGAPDNEYWADLKKSIVRVSMKSIP
ncbi:hypothetical protein D9757_002858 [Collybiopsis confluens]|uniref:Pre-rRNA-processing protein n=1 Tax=Collybiopsis confluens TaxID=2823264 RepID=A0A8H5HW52_9AGAR|nr:hypothetical protein D9757_002858 [Collybiopsis confluens]